MARLPTAWVVRHWMVAGVAALCALGVTTVVAGCGSSPEDSRAPSHSTRVSSTPVTTPATTFASVQILAAARARLPSVASAPAGSVGARWTLLGVADGGRRVMLQTVASGGCAMFVGVVVTETATMVTISPRTVVSRHAGSLCPDHQVLTRGSVVLSEPLGARHLSQGDPTYPR